ncbi:MAG TPA: hypothetical protein VFK05_25665 [Polyangiaceae bacterium]|nr:hypothetical protein [Polyangiaceae bacterium]
MTVDLIELTTRAVYREQARKEIEAIADWALTCADFYEDRAPKKAERFLVRAERRIAKIERDLAKFIRERERRYERDWGAQEKGTGT